MIDSGRIRSQETRQYNSLEQLIQLTTYGGISHAYNYTAGANNGQIVSAVVSGETITYLYDSLNRMASASGSGWGESYGYDAFGSLLSKTITQGTPPSLSQAVNPVNNQIVGQSYDLNGNQLTAPGVTGSVTYDAENHMVTAPGIQYAYDSQNRRVWSGTLGSGGALISQTAYLHGLDGQKLGAYALAIAVSPTALSDAAIETDAYFVGKRVAITNASGQTWFSDDRLGSNASVSLYPWGEDRGTPAPNDQVKFATYTRDSATLLDYAMNRYYSNAYGRFMTPDPSGSGSANPQNPQSWNRYPYTAGDPVNRVDPSGLDFCVDPDCVGGGWGYDPTGYCPPSEQSCGGGGGFIGSGSGGGVNIDPGWITLWSVFLFYQPPGGGGGAVVPPFATDCNALTAAVGFAGLTYQRGLTIWEDGSLWATTSDSYSATIAALAAVTWQGESSFSTNPINNPNVSKGKVWSVDYGPFMINPYFYGNATGPVIGTNGGGQQFNGNPDANITYGITILTGLYTQFGGNAAGRYVGSLTNPNAVNRQNTWNAWGSRLVSLFSNKNCFPHL